MQKQQDIQKKTFWPDKSNKIMASLEVKNMISCIVLKPKFMYVIWFLMAVKFSCNKTTLNSNATIEHIIVS